MRCKQILVVAMQYSFMFHHPKFTEFCELYDQKNGGSVQSKEFNRHGTPNPVVTPSVSMLAQMPSVMLSKFEDYLNGDYA